MSQTEISILREFKKARTHLDLVVRLIENSSDYKNILQQNLAVIGILKSAHSKLLKKCLEANINRLKEDKDSAKSIINAVVQINKFYNKY